MEALGILLFIITGLYGFSKLGPVMKSRVLFWSHVETWGRANKEAAEARERVWRDSTEDGKDGKVGQVSEEPCVPCT